MTVRGPSVEKNALTALAPQHQVSLRCELSERASQGVPGSESVFVSTCLATIGSQWANPSHSIGPSGIVGVPSGQPQGESISTLDDGESMLPLPVVKGATGGHADPSHNNLVAAVRSGFALISGKLPSYLHEPAGEVLGLMIAYQETSQPTCISALLDEFGAHLHSLDILFELSPGRQRRVYLSLASAYRCSSPWIVNRRLIDAFRVIVCILEVEQAAVRAPLEGHSFVRKIIELDAAICPIQDFFCGDQHAASPESVRAFCAGPVDCVLSRHPAGLARSIFAALNARLAYGQMSGFGTQKMIDTATVFLENIPDSFSVTPLPSSLPGDPEGPLAPCELDQAFSVLGGTLQSSLGGIGASPAASWAVDPAVSPSVVAKFSTVISPSPVSLDLATDPSIERIVKFLRARDQMHQPVHTVAFSVEDDTRQDDRLEPQPQRTHGNFNLLLYATLLGTGLVLPRIGDYVSRWFFQPAGSLALSSPIETSREGVTANKPFVLPPERSYKSPALPAPPSEDALELEGTTLSDVPPLSDIPPPIAVPDFITSFKPNSNVVPQELADSVAELKETNGPQLPVKHNRLPELPDLRSAKNPRVAVAGGSNLSDQASIGVPAMTAPLQAPGKGELRPGDPSPVMQTREDPYSELPVALGQAMRRKVQAFLLRDKSIRQPGILKAYNVVLESPLANSKESEQVPVVILNDGQVVLLAPPSHSRLKASIQAWADAQPLPPKGFVTPVVLSFQPRG